MANKLRLTILVISLLHGGCLSDGQGKQNASFWSGFLYDKTYVIMEGNSNVRLQADEFRNVAQITVKYRSYISRIICVSLSMRLCMLYIYVEAGVSV